MALGGIVRGTSTRLRTPTEDDLGSFNRWMADMRVRRATRVWHEPAMPATWKERLTEQTKDKDSVLWCVESAGELVGLVRIVLGWDRRDYAWIDQVCIDPDRWGKGHAGDALLALHRYLFDYLDLQRVNTTIRDGNAGAAKLFAAIGYTEFARGHSVYYRDGEYVDEVWLMCERAAWNERFAGEREYAAPHIR